VPSTFDVSKILAPPIVPMYPVLNASFVRSLGFGFTKVLVNAFLTLYATFGFKTQE
jgi:hypothetical protein